MSNNLKHNKKEFIHGSIYKITLKNFMIYSEVEFFPGQSLNLIIGPNGSGKSSIICAIILGLGGQPSDINKNKHVSRFIKKETDEAIIEIELYQRGKTNTIITTTLNRWNKNFLYQKDHVTITRDDLLSYTKGLGIQVNNLCQVLPQLRVQEFSNLSPRQLLVNTISAISGFNGFIRNDLIDYSTELKNLVRKKQILEENVKVLQKRNIRIESKVKIAEGQAQLRNQLRLCDMKEKWILYKELEENVIRYNEEIECESGIVKELEKEKREKVKEKNDIDKKLKHGERRLNFIKKEIDHCKESINKTMDSIMSDERKCNKIEDSLKQKEKENVERENELNYLRDKLKELELDLSKFKNEHGEESSLQKQYKEKDEIVKKLHQQRDELESKILSMEKDKLSITKSIDTYTEQLDKLNNKYETKKLLKDWYNHTYQALEWLDENRSLFKHRVYNPMLLEIDFDNEEDAKFLENTVSNKDLTAFCFEDSQDMEKFLKIVRSDLGFKKVNACTVLSSETNLTPPPPIDNIMQYGFSRYLRDTFRAPAAVAHYLCARYAVHRVPLGDAHTAHADLNVPLYFTDKHRVTVKQSIYSGLYSKYTTFIRPAVLLKGYPAQIRSIEEKMNNLVNEQNVMMEQLGNLERDKDILNQRIKIEKEAKDDIRKKLNELKEITKSIEVNEEERKIDAVDMEAEKVRARQQQAELTRVLLTRQPRLLQDVRRLHAASLYHGMLRNRFDVFDQEYVQFEEKVKELDIKLDKQKKKTQALASKLRANEKEMDRIRGDIQDSGNKLPNDPDFAYKKEFNALPEHAKELRCKYYEIKRGLNSNKNYSLILEEYKERVDTINEKNDEIKEKEVKINELKDIIQIKRPQWLKNLEKLVETINESFGNMFKKLGYVGEVLLDKSQETTDSSQLGVSIMVSYGGGGGGGGGCARLDAARQSGGERALATACYLLALHAAAPAPFRCLDEINQGMDAENERNFMKILMEVSSEENQCQYFVLSPKLLKDLEYNDTVKVHVIMSGESNVSSHVWKIDTFLDKAREYGKDNSDVDE